MDALKGCRPETAIYPTLIDFLSPKTSYKLDRKSSRGMIYENEELRLRTININAEVEKGQSDIKRLRRENEQLRREIWSLRDEYDRLNKRYKANKYCTDNAIGCGGGGGGGGNHRAAITAGAANNQGVACDGPSDSYSDDTDYCDICKNNDADIAADDEDNCSQPHSNHYHHQGYDHEQEGKGKNKCQIDDDQAICNDKNFIQKNLQSATIGNCSSTAAMAASALATMVAATDVTMPFDNASSNGDGNFHQQQQQPPPKLQMNFDHLSIVSEENLSNSDGNLTNHEGGGGGGDCGHMMIEEIYPIRIEEQDIDIPKPLTPIEIVSNEINDIQSTVPPLSYFENVVQHQHMGSALESISDCNMSANMGETVIQTNGWDYNIQSPFAQRKFGAATAASPQHYNHQHHHQQLFQQHFHQQHSKLGENSVSNVTSNTTTTATTTTTTVTVSAAPISNNDISNHSSAKQKSPKHFFSPIKPRLRLDTSLAAAGASISAAGSDESSSSSSSSSATAAAVAAAATAAAATAAAATAVAAAAGIVTKSHQHSGPPDIYVTNALPSSYQFHQIASLTPSKQIPLLPLRSTQNHKNSQEPIYATAQKNTTTTNSSILNLKEHHHHHHHHYQGLANQNSHNLTDVWNDIESISEDILQIQLIEKADGEFENDIKLMTTAAAAVAAAATTTAMATYVNQKPIDCGSSNISKWISDPKMGINEMMPADSLRPCCGSNNGHNDGHLMKTSKPYRSQMNLLLSYNGKNPTITPSPTSSSSSSSSSSSTTSSLTSSTSVVDTISSHTITNTNATRTESRRRLSIMAAAGKSLKTTTTTEQQPIICSLHSSPVLLRRRRTQSLERERTTDSPSPNIPDPMTPFPANLMYLGFDHVNNAAVAAAVATLTLTTSAAAAAAAAATGNKNRSPSIYVSQSSTNVYDETNQLPPSPLISTVALAGVGAGGDDDGNDAAAIHELSECIYTGVGISDFIAEAKDDDSKNKIGTFDAAGALIMKQNDNTGGNPPSTAEIVLKRRNATINDGHLVESEIPIDKINTDAGQIGNCLTKQKSPSHNYESFGSGSEVVTKRKSLRVSIMCRGDKNLCESETLSTITTNTTTMTTTTANGASTNTTTTSTNVASSTCSSSSSSRTNTNSKANESSKYFPTEMLDSTAAMATTTTTKATPTAAAVASAAAPAGATEMSMKKLAHSTPNTPHSARRCNSGNTTTTTISPSHHHHSRHHHHHHHSYSSADRHATTGGGGIKLGQDSTKGGGDSNSSGPVRGSPSKASNNQQQQQHQQQKQHLRSSAPIPSALARTKCPRRYSEGTVCSSTGGGGGGGGVVVSGSSSVGIGRHSTSTTTADAHHHVHPHSRSHSHGHGHGHHSHHHIHLHPDSHHETGTISVSDRNTNSLASSRESSLSLSMRSQRRKISVSSHTGGKIPWCGCWGNGCL